MVMNAPPQGRGGYTGTNIDAAGIITPPNPLEDPQAAIRRVMGMLGVNPGNISPMSNAIRQKAAALVNQLVVNAADAGPSGFDALAQPAQALSMLADLVRQGAGGGKIFGGKGNDTLSRLAAIAESGANQGDAATASPGAALAASLLSSPEQAETLYLQAKYGGLAPRALAAMTQSLGGIMDAYQKQLEGGAASAFNPAGLLNTLLGRPGANMIGAPGAAEGGSAAGGTAGALGGATPAGPAGTGALAQGAGVPSTSTPSVPSALGDPSQAMLPGGAMSQYGGNAAYSTMNPSLMAALQNWQPPPDATSAAAAGGAPPGFDYLSAIGQALPPPGQWALQGLQQGGGYAQQNPGVVSAVGGSLLPEPLGTLYRMGLGLRGSPAAQGLPFPQLPGR